jgi:hypothetical protein
VTEGVLSIRLDSTDMVPRASTWHCSLYQYSWNDKSWQPPGMSTCSTAGAALVLSKEHSPAHGCTLCKVTTSQWRNGSEPTVNHDVSVYRFVLVVMGSASAYSMCMARYAASRPCA